MKKDLIEQFAHMEKVILGTKYIPLEYETQFGCNYYRGGKGYQCPKCKTGFSCYKKEEIKCPWCDHEWEVK